MMEVYGPDRNFLGITEPEFSGYNHARFVIQQVPYEHTSSYIGGSDKGPAAIIEASHFVEFYDEVLGAETYKNGGIATLAPLDFKDAVDADAVQRIEDATTRLLTDGKFVVSLGAEHTVTLGFVRAFKKHFGKFSVLQLDAHADLRASYHDNLYSHASVMARVNEEQLPLTQIGIRALSKPEADHSHADPLIHTFYAHQLRRNAGWMQEAVNTLEENVYITIDADGFDPSIMPAVGTAEPGGLYWDETMDFLRLVCEQRKVIGFDIVECAPVQGSILSEYTLACLCYRLIGFVVASSH